MLQTDHRTDCRLLREGLTQLSHLLEARLARESGGEPVPLRPWRLADDGSQLAARLLDLELRPLEQMLVLLALVPELDPGLLGRSVRKYATVGKEDAGYGGLRGRNHRGILPTGELAQFLLGGEQLSLRLAVRELLAPDARLRAEGILELLEPPAGEPPLAGQLRARPDWVEQLLTGRVAPPAFSATFPAERVTTTLDWEDLVLPARTLTEINYLRNYLDRGAGLEQAGALGRHARRGYRALFHGPPGTGKTLTAALLGRATGRPVFRVDLSMVVSKWIGETEKNLANLFHRAEHRGWVLFFDEADALFGKRSEVRQAQDRYGNQTTSYLLQRVEHYDGLCILATNHRSNLDKAFARRFEAIVPFPAPDVAERRRLWERILPPALPLEKGLTTELLAGRYDLTGATIANAVRHAALECLAAGGTALGEELIVTAIRREYDKEDRIFG